MTTPNLRKSISRSLLRRGCLLIAFALCCFALSPAAQASSTNWTDGSGDWFTGTNWSNGVPDCTKDASVNNAGKAAINSSGATALSLTLGYNATNSGTVSVDGTNGGTLLVQACPSVPILGDITVGYQGTGTLTISNGGMVESGSGYIAASTSVSATSNGSVTVTGSSSRWQVGDLVTLYAAVFVGGNENGSGGTALLSIMNGGSVIVQNNGGTTPVTVGPSGTLTGNGSLDTTNSNMQLTDVKGTLAPNWTLTLSGNLSLESSATTNSNVTPQNSGSVDVSVSGTAALGGRLSVTMTGTFTCATTRYTLLYAASGIDPNHRTFDRYSIKYPTNQGFVPNISYDANHVYLNLVFSNPPCG